MNDTAIEHSPDLRFGEECHPGYERADNQDRTIHGHTPVGALFAISDGVGGNQDGALAADTVTAELLRSLQEAQAGGGAKRALAAAVQSANARVYNEAAPPNRNGRGQRSMSATLVATLIDTAREFPVAIVANVGDSRAYLLRDGMLSRITTDHTAVQNLIRSGALTPEEAERHPQSSVLTRSMGQASQVKPGLERVLLQPGDELLLCSDGLHGYVREPDILAEMLRPGATPQGKASTLLQLALNAGGRDNISVQVIAPKIPCPGSPDAIAALRLTREPEQPVRTPDVAADRLTGAFSTSVPSAAPLSSVPASPAPHRSPWRHLLVAAIAIALLLGILLGAYVWWQARPVEPSQQSLAGQFGAPGYR